MTGRCDTCGNWLLERKAIYGDGTEIVTHRAPDGKGRCRVLDTYTDPGFGCVSHELGGHVDVINKEGAPWQNWVVDACPDCKGQGTITHGVNDGHLDYSVCGRCVGTGKVRHYDDGYIGEERHRRHPKEGNQQCTPTVDPGTILASAQNPKADII